MPLRVSYKIFSKITFVDIIDRVEIHSCNDAWGPLGRGPQNFFKNRFLVLMGTGTRYATAGPYILWRIYCV